MKRLFLCGLLAASGLAFNGCNNGDYDARPDDNWENEINPLNPKGGMNTSFDWTGQAPMSMEVNGVFWKADGANYINTWTFPGDPTEYVFIGGQRNSQSPVTGISFLLEKSAVWEGAEIDVSWTKGSAKSYVSYSKNVDSSSFGVIDPENYLYNSGYSAHGKVKILEYTSNHIKGMFYLLGRNQPQGFYVNLQKGYFDITN